MPTFDSFLRAIYKEDNNGFDTFDDYMDSIISLPKIIELFDDFMKSRK